MPGMVLFPVSKGALLYFRNALHPISRELLVAKLRVKIIITLWSIQYAFSISTLKHKLQMFFKAHLRKILFFCFFKKTYYVKVIAIMCMCKVKHTYFKMLSQTRHSGHFIVLQAKTNILQMGKTKWNTYLSLRKQLPAGLERTKFPH